MKSSIFIKFLLILLYQIRAEAIFLTLAKLSLLVDLIPTQTPISETVPDIIAYDGYPVERHHVETSDGYIIELHRIPLVNTNHTQNKVIFLPHCYLCSSASWVYIGPKSLAYLLSNAGYDVWMMNARGTKYSLGHKTLSYKRRKFWEFSLTEAALIDLKESIDYAMNITNASKVDFLGYSMGTTLLFMLLSEYPEYNDKIRKAALMAPFTYVVHSSGIFPELSLFADVVENVMADMRIYTFPPRDLPLNQIISTVCDHSNILLYQFVCPMAIDGLMNTTSRNTARNRLGFIFRHYPEPSSLRTLLHFYQFRNTGDFKKYDFGRYMNLREYGSVQPPHFNISRTTIPLALYWSKADELSTEKDLRRLRPELVNVVEDYQIPVHNFQHGDFIWGRHADTLIYKRVLRFLSSGKE